MQYYNRDDLGGFFWHRLHILKKQFLTIVTNDLMHIFFYLRGVKIGKGTVVKGYVYVSRFPSSRIEFGNNCIFNAASWSVAHRISAPSSLVTLNERAEIIIGNNVGVTAVTIAAATSVRIGNNVLIGVNSLIMDTDWHNADPEKRWSKDVPTRAIIIEDNVFIGANCVITKGVRIGKNSVIGANAAVFNSIPPNSIAVGNPCTVVIRKNWKI